MKVRNIYGRRREPGGLWLVWNNRLGELAAVTETEAGAKALQRQLNAAWRKSVTQ